jgi:hypothetical protein
MRRRIYGKHKQGIGFGHAKVRGYNPLSAPVIAATRPACA